MEEMPQYALWLLSGVVLLLADNFLMPTLRLFCYALLALSRIDLS
jgi:hypothetical protein